jgi:hypothetical protein
MTSQFPGLIHPLQLKLVEINYLFVPEPPLLVKLCVHASSFHMWVKFRPKVI